VEGKADDLLDPADDVLVAYPAHSGDEPLWYPHVDIVNKGHQSRPATTLSYYVHQPNPIGMDVPSLLTGSPPSN